MPCSTPDYPIDRTEHIEYDEMIRFIGKTYSDARYYKRMSDQATRLLCDVCKTFELHGIEMSHELQRWWHLHKNWDENK